MLSDFQISVQDRGLFTLSLPSWKRKVLLPPHKRYNMQKAHLVLLGVRLDSSARQILRTAAIAAYSCNEGLLHLDSGEWSVRSS